MDRRVVVVAIPVAGCGMNATWAVGSLPAGDSPYGLHDMAGNVWEWTLDSYGAYTGAQEVDPVGPGTGTQKVGRGGGFQSAVASQRAGVRQQGATTDNASDLGMRCVKSYP